MEYQNNDDDNSSVDDGVRIGWEEEY